MKKTIFNFISSFTQGISKASERNRDIARFRKSLWNQEKTRNELLKKIGLRGLEISKNTNGSIETISEKIALEQSGIKEIQEELKQQLDGDLESKSRIEEWKKKGSAFAKSKALTFEVTMKERNLEKLFTELGEILFQEKKEFLSEKKETQTLCSKIEAIDARCGKIEETLKQIERKQRKTDIFYSKPKLTSFLIYLGTLFLLLMLLKVGSFIFHLIF